MNEKMKRPKRENFRSFFFYFREDRIRRLQKGNSRRSETRSLLCFQSKVVRRKTKHPLILNYERTVIYEVQMKKISKEFLDRHRRYGKKIQVFVGFTATVVSN